MNNNSNIDFKDYGAYVDIDSDDSVLDGHFTATELRHIANEMDKELTVAFCMRCFANSAVLVTKDTNFCHYCGSEGTCIPMKADEAAYLRMNIENAVRNAKR